MMWFVVSYSSSERQKYILQRLRSNGMVPTVDASRALHVSSETIRRDFLALEEAGLLKRVYGGATAPQTFRRSEPPHIERMSINAEAKESMGRTAASLIPNDATIFVDVGTTTAALAAAIKTAFRGTIVTHSLLVANHLAEDSCAEVLIAPGRLRRGEWSVGGATTHGFLARLQYDVAFLSCGGVDANIGVTDFNFDDAEVKRSVASRSNQVYVLADSTKHNRIGTYKISSWQDLSGLITNSQPPEGIASAIRLSGGEVYTCCDANEQECPLFPEPSVRCALAATNQCASCGNRNAISSYH